MDLIIYPPKSPILINIFGFPVRYYSLIMALVFLFGIVASYNLFKKKYSKNEADLFLDYSPIIILFSIIGARFFYVIGEIEYYVSYPKEIFFINHGGISIFGAIIFGAISLFVLSKKKKFDFLAHCDIISVVMPLCQSIGRLGNYFNQEAYGRPFDGFIKLFVDENYRIQIYKDIDFYHPAFLYESILNFFLFIFLLIVFFNNKKLNKGSICAIYLFFYSLIRIFLETIRIDSILNISGFPIAQIIAFLIAIVAIVGFIFINKNHTQKD